MLRALIEIPWRILLKIYIHLEFPKLGGPEDRNERLPIDVRLDLICLLTAGIECQFLQSKGHRSERTVCVAKTTL